MRTKLCTLWKQRKHLNRIFLKSFTVAFWLQSTPERSREVLAPSYLFKKGPHGLSRSHLA
jgi:hypothetical protein